MNAAVVDRGPPPGTGNAGGSRDPRRGVPLAALLDAIDPLCLRGNPGVLVRDVAVDSRRVTEGAVFVAVPGTRDDGARFIAEAVARGAVAVITEAEAPEVDCTVVRVACARVARSRLAAAFHGHPSRVLPVVAVTGTNGKTTTAKMLQAIAEYDRGPTVFLGTIGYEVAGLHYDAENTTPDPTDVQRHLREGLERGARLAVMEVSSHALDQGRVADVRFQVAAFTNLTPEHLDYHRSLAAYRDAKGRLFEQLSPAAVAVLNADDPASDVFASRTEARVLTYGLERRADVSARLRRIDADGLWFTLTTSKGEVDVTTRLVGRYNLMNALAAAACALALGHPLEAIRGGFEMLKGVPGRLEPIDCGQDFRVLVDYAHTDDALLKVLLNLRPLTHGRIITVFGCGGDRDRTKRPRMGRVASEHSDLAILTSDNPRTEDPDRILTEVAAGCVEGAAVIVEPDRRRAIEAAMRAARGGDIVLIAGKGHEDHQIVGTTKLRFDDREVAREVLWSL
jgi:UDP-N-acetylmuramoyl-L-alanyl-D-glutamate--2,6-diaminopimelate ligase